MNRRSLSLMLSCLLIAGCSLPGLKTTPGDDVVLSVSPALQDADRTVASTNYALADIDHLMVRLFTLDGSSESAVVRGSGAVQASVASAAISVPITFSTLRYQTTYRVRAYAYRATGEATDDLISLNETSYVDVSVGSNTHPSMAALPVKLKGTLFDSVATSSFALTDGTYTYATPSMVALDTRRISTFAGTGTGGFGGDGGAATSAQLFGPRYLTVDASGCVYFCDQGNHRVRKVALDGTITTVAGDGAQGFSGDGGPATSAHLSGPNGLAFDASGNLFIADTDNNRIRKMALDGTISTVAGDGTFDGQGLASVRDGGPAASASLHTPNDVAFDSAGNLYIADTNHYRVRKVASNGIITTVVGSAYGDAAEGIQAATASIKFPQALAFDASGNLYLSDTGAQKIRKVAPNGIISTIAGTGTAGFSGDGGPALIAQVSSPFQIVCDPHGTLFFVDADNRRVRQISRGVISTVVGNGTTSASGDGGYAINAGLGLPWGVTLDASGSMYISDMTGSRIRKVVR